MIAGDQTLPRENDRFPDARETWMLAAAAVVVLVVTLWRISVALPRDAGLNHVSGCWLAQAQDLAHGVFYRPLVSPDGYGGTRFMPLHVVLHAALMRLGVAAVAAGYFISLLSAAGLAAGLYALMRKLGAGRFFSAACAVLWLGTFSAQFAVTTIRADLLPAALNVWGLACCLPREGKPGGERLPVAAVLFVLAFAAKIATVFGFAGALAALLMQRKTRQAVTLALMTLAGILLVVVVVYLTSGGRWFESFASSATGGASMWALLRGPLMLFRQGREWDVFALLLWMVALASLLRLKRADLAAVLPMSFVATAAVTAVIFGSPGVSYNHLLDLNVISLAVVAGQAVRAPAQRGFTVMLLAVFAMAGAVYTTARLARVDRTPLRLEIMDVVRLTASDSRPLLSTNSLVPFFRGERAYVSDFFMLGVLCRRDAAVAAGLLERIARHDFAAVVLGYDPRIEGQRETDGAPRLCQGFEDTVLSAYPNVITVRSFFVCLPEPDSPLPPGEYVFSVPTDIHYI